MASTTRSFCFATMGMMFMAGAMDLVTLYIGLETMAIATYILVGFLRSNQRSNEASMKYFLLGAFSSGILLYGMSLLYGIAGSTRFVQIAQALAERPPADPISMMAMITLSAGLFFKIAAVPFHQWTPDAYEGAPTSITAFMSVAVKAASFAMMIRIFMIAIYPLRPQWVTVMAAVSVLTMTVGNIAAITQSNVKRLLAYSSISHAGYILIGFIAGNETGLTAVPLYLLIYTFTNIGAWAVIVALRRRDVIGEHIDEMSGLFFKNPGAAILMLIFLLSLAGIPPTAGFIAKVLSVCRRHRDRPQRVGGDCGLERRYIDLLLPAHRRRDVHARRDGKDRSGLFARPSCRSGRGFRLHDVDWDLSGPLHQYGPAGGNSGVLSRELRQFIRVIGVIRGLSTTWWTSSVQRTAER